MNSLAYFLTNVVLPSVLSVLFEENSLSFWGGQRLGFQSAFFLPPLTYFLVCQSNSMQALKNLFQKTDKI